MSHVICEKNAGAVIKSYSPNLIVHPYLYESQNVPKGIEIPDIVSKVTGVLDRVHVVVIGPGLGRDSLMLNTVAVIITEARNRDLPIVIDADGLYLIQSNMDLIRNYRQAVLTPNIMEFKRLADAAGIEANVEPTKKAALLANKFGGVTILEKGKYDYISNGHTTIVSDIPGGLKRVSGQGDTLSGSIATFLAWRKAYLDKLWEHSGDLSEEHLMLLASFGGSVITRKAAALAFQKKGRAVVTSDISDEVGPAFKELFEN